MDDGHADARRHLVASLERSAAETGVRTGVARFSEQVLAAVAAVPRHAFVPSALEDLAWEDSALPIGHGQTISQPFVVALMTELLALEPHHRVLEIGTGCGYQAAILAHLAAEVWSVEFVEALAAAAGERLARLGCANVHVRQGDGRAGWPEAAPFDSIIVTAAAGSLPQAIAEQLRPGGRIIAPIGRAPWAQELILFRKDQAGEMHQSAVLPVVFVPLV